MAVIRGSQQQFTGIAEVTFGTTPATPTMVEFPVVNFNPSSTNGTIESAQLRSHPFVDQLIPTMFSHSIGVDWELQAANHDNLLQMIFGDTWTTNAIKVKDVLSSMTIESKASASLYNQFTGYFINKLDLSVGSGDNAPIKISTTGMAKAATFDAGATIATAVTAATTPTPMVFTGATLTIGGSARSLTNVSMSLQRQVDPLYVIGSNVAREYVPAKVMLTGSVTLPYDDATQSTLFSGFSNAPLVLLCQDTAATKSYSWAVPKVKFTKFGRQVNTRGAILQQIDWEASYDSSSGTVMTVTRVP